MCFLGLEMFCRAHFRFAQGTKLREAEIAAGELMKTKLKAE
jgi:hypothetical protein